jgi:autotransporter-associated beta strand protein
MFKESGSHKLKIMPHAATQTCLRRYLAPAIPLIPIMKTQPQALKPSARLPKILFTLLWTSLLAAPAAFAASQTWTNAPVDSTWTNVLNWNALAVPGADNMSGNSVNADIATFTNPIPGSLIGGASNPVLIDDATIAGDRSRQISGIVFDTATCGAYAFTGTAPTVYPGVGLLYVSHNGSITMNAPVNSSQTFLIPVLTRLPSSTAGVFNFVNNATNPAATLQFYAVTNDSANTRGTTFVLDGSNTGTNAIATLSEGVATGGQGLTKQGAGTWVLPNASVFNNSSANTLINLNKGLLIVGNAASFGAAPNVTINSNAILQVAGVNLTTPNINLNGNGTFQMAGAGTLIKATVGTATGINAALATTSSSDVLTAGAAANDITGGAVSSTLHIAGPGTVLLGFANNYAGAWSVDAGTLQLASGVTGALGTGPQVNVGAGGTFDLTQVTASGGSYNPGPAAVGGSGTGTAVGSTAATIKADPSGTINLVTGSKSLLLTYRPTSFTGDLAHPALYVSQGTLSLGNNAFTINNASGTPLGAGTYQLILQASGNIISGGGYSVVGVTGSGLAAGDVGSIQVINGEVDLVVSAYVPKSLVWQGGNPNSTWDLATTPNWLNGASLSVFNNSDLVIFNATGSANPTVTLAGTLSPGNVTVDTSANNYTLAGSGQIGGATGLAKVGSGTLLVQTVNTYAGGTVVSNGTFQVGVNNAVPSTGAGDVTVINPGILDLNTYSDTINALIGSGTVDTVAGGASVLTFGNNNDSGTFSGVIRNTAGTLGLTQNGTGIETLTGTNTYTGPTVINSGTLRIGNSQSFPAGNAVTINGGTLDLAANVTVGMLAGAGSIANNGSSTTNSLVTTNTSTFNGLITDGGAAGGGLNVLVAGGTLQLNGDNTYSGGTILASGTTLGIGNGPAQPGTGGIIASNGTTIAATSTSSASTGIPNPITTVDNANVSFTSGEAADNFSGQFNGSALATNVFYGNGSIGGAMSFSNFFGTVIFTNAEMRWFNAAGGGDNTTFILLGSGTGGFFTRDADIIHLGALFGNGEITGPSVTPTPSYWIGGKNTDSLFSGSIIGSNNIVKIGTGTLTFNGGVFTNIYTLDGFNYITNLVVTNNLLNYIGATTVSNGVLALAVPVCLTNYPPTPITLASATAVLDASQMGYISNEYDSDGVTVTNQALVTNGVFEVISGQTLAGLGTIRAGKVLLDVGSVLNVGLPTGLLAATNNIELAGAVSISLNRTNTITSSELGGQSFTIDPTATLVITNAGSALVNGDTFTVFSQGISGFASVTLPPTDPTGTTNYIWQNNLAVNGTIKLTGGGLNPVNQNPTNIVFSASGGTLNLSWPADHTGWYLQAQTNNLTTGLGTNWVDVPGSSSIDSTNLVIDPTQPTVFYRLSLQP